jgi:DNA primase
MKVNLTSEATFDGIAMTARAVAESMASFPPEAYVTIETWDSQRDGSGWRVKARWTEDR